jgi:YYY domain-containing protein
MDWDAGQHLHPDERFLTMVEGAIRPGLTVPSPAGPDGPVRVVPAGLLESYFDTARSALNPHNVGFGFFVYGTFPLFAVRAVAEVLHSVGYDKVHLLGRVLSVLSDLVTVWLTYLIGRRLYGPRVGLLAGALLALCVLHIQQAHFFVFDSYLVTLVVAAFYFCVDVAETGRWRSFALAGVFLGLATATKLSMAVFAPVIALAGLIYLWRAYVPSPESGAPSLEARLRALWDSGLVTQVLGGGLLAAVVAFLVFRVFQPYAFAGPGFFDLRLNPRWLDNIAYQTKTQEGTVDLPPSIQWANTTPLLFPWRNMVLWGMGLPLGLAAWAGAAAAGAIVLWRGRWQHLLVLAWALPSFVYFASVLNKTMRYLLPVYPFFVLLAAWGLVALYDWAKRSQRLRAGRLALRADRLALALIVFVVAGSAAWAYAFTRIYTRPTTRVAASQWIYQTLPKGSVLANEHWDDPLPVPLPGYDPAPYAGPQLPLYDPDEPKKIDTIVRMLTEADYINLTSNRLYGSIPRMPQRYPMTTEYYRRLFAGDLGFDLVKTVASYPTLGPLTISDDRAEEAFTVYDHPKVLIFKKRPDFSPDRVRQILSAVPLDDVRQVPPVKAGQTQLLEPDWLREANTAGGTWADLFALDGPANRLAPLLWWLALAALGWLAAPLVWLALPRLPDRGLGLARPIGLLAVAWGAWWLASLRVLPWGRGAILLAALVLAGASAAALARRGPSGPRWRAWLAWLRRERGLVLATEAVFLGAYLLFLLIRAANPDLWHPARGGEKPMELSYLTAVVKTTYFPPYDPWFAGGYLNYYYFGYVLVAALIRLTGVMPTIAFNVAVPAFYALTAGAAFSVTAGLFRSLGFGAPGEGSGGWPGRSRWAMIGAGLAGVLLLVGVGNLDGFAQLVERLARAGGVTGTSPVPGLAGLISLAAGVPAVLFGGRPLEPFDYWRSSRVIPNNTINEFPFWTFLFADLHAHLLSIPYQVVALGALLNLVSGGRYLPGGRPRGESEHPLRWLWGLIGWRRVGEVVLLAWLVGALYVINSWEFPTYLLLTAGALVIAEVAPRATPRGAPRGAPRGGLTGAGLVRAGVSAGAILVLAKPLFAPFWRYYETFYSSVTLWTEDKTRLDHYLIVNGLFVFAIVTFAVLAGRPAWGGTGWARYLAARWRWLAAWGRFSALERALGLERRAPAPGYLALLGVGGLLVLGFLAAGLLLPAFLVALLGLVVAGTWERRDSPALLLAGLMAATGIALGIFVEFFALQGDIGRMNTVFKLYLQVWVLWAPVSAAALVWALVSLRAEVRRPAPAVAAGPAPDLGRRPVLEDLPVNVGTGDGDGVDWPTTGPSGPPGDDEDHDARAPGPEPRAGGDGSAGAAPPASGSGLGTWRWLWSAVAGALLLAVLAFPLGGTPARLADRFNPLPPTLDGMAYLPYATIRDDSREVQTLHPGGVTLQGEADYAAIRWLLTNVQGSPVVLEASIPEYRWGARVAKYTGLPAVLGWRWHEAQQRGTYAPTVDQRLRDVQTMFDDPSPARALPLLQKYRVRYVYVGDLERAYYGADGLAKFDQLTDVFRPVYQQDGVTIYEVVGASGA